MKTLTRSITLILLLLPSLVSAGDTLQATDSSSVLADAVSAEKSGALNRAEDLFKEASILPEAQEQGTLGLARVLTSENRREDATQLLVKFVKDVNPFSVDAHISLLDIYLTEEKIAAVDAETAVIAKLRPGYEPFQERYGILSYRSGNYKAAVKSLSHVLAKEPDHTRALSLRYQAYLKLGMYEPAAADVSHLIDLSPATPENYRTLSNIYAQMGLFDRAISTVKKGLTSNNSMPEDRDRLVVQSALAYADLAEMLIGTGGYQHAKEALKDALQLHVLSGPAKARVDFVAGELMEAENQPGKAQRFFKKAFVADPHFAESGVRLADALDQSGAKEKASAVMNQVVSLNPDNESYAKRLVELYKTSDRKDELGVFLRNYIDAHPVCAWAMLEYVHLLSTIGSLESAEPALARSVAEESTPADSYLLYVKVLDTEKKYIEATRVLDRAIQKLPKDARLRFDLGLAYEHAGNFAKADQAYKAVPVSNPDLYYQAHVNAGLLEQKNGTLEKALATFVALRSKVGESDELVEKIKELKTLIHNAGGNENRSVAGEGEAQ